MNKGIITLIYLKLLYGNEVKIMSVRWVFGRAYKYFGFKKEWLLKQEKQNQRNSVI